MLKIKNSGLDQYGVEPFEQWQFGTSGAKRVNVHPYDLSAPTTRHQLALLHPEHGHFPHNWSTKYPCDQ